MKRRDFAFYLCLLIWASAPSTLVTSAHAAQPELVIYAYDSFVAKGGLGAEIFPLFEKKHGCKLKVISAGDSGQLVNRLQLDAERGAQVADVVIGLDPQSWDRVQKHLMAWSDTPFKRKLKPKGLENLKPEVLRAMPEESLRTLVPFDYGVYAFMADMEALKSKGLAAPTSFEDLLQPKWQRNLILEDPRTSSPGLAFVLYAQALHSQNSEAFWKSFRNQWLTLAPGWDAAYGLFMKGEAPLVWSYTTSQAYHIEHAASQEHAQKGRYRALILKEGQPLQIEGAALVKRKGKVDAKRLKLARKFLTFLLSPDVQKHVPLKNWMLPVRKDVRLPAAFKSLPKPTRIIPLPTHAKEIEKTLIDWQTAISR